MTVPRGGDVHDARTVAERRKEGEALRAHAPLTGPSGWRPAKDRPDPVALLEEQAATRIPELMPVRNGRMMASPFAFYRGAALLMAADLTTLPVSGVQSQLSGRRASQQLRDVRVAGAGPRLRHHRLRRDTRRSVGMGPAPIGGQPGRGRAWAWLRCPHRASRRARGGPLVCDAHDRVRDDAGDRRLLLQGRRACHPRVHRRPGTQLSSGHDQGGGAPRRSARASEDHRADRREAPDRRPPAR